MKRFLTLAIVICTLQSLLYANNLSISNGMVSGGVVSFNLSWDNAWNLTNSAGNHDAVWVFLKGKNSFGIWSHIDIEISKNFHYAQSPLVVEPASDGKGAFVLKATDGIANIESTLIELKLNAKLSNFVEIKIFGIEMVFVPQGEFFLGDGASISSLANVGESPILISSEKEINISLMSIFNPNSQFTPQSLPNKIPESFPKGFKSFYMMKYEVSQYQYIDFLNTLTFAQQKARTAILPSSQMGKFAMVNPFQPDSLYRNGIVIAESGVLASKPAIYAIDYNKNLVYNDVTDGVHRAANFLNWADLSAYLDWAALRPLTEMEFEKACRGSNVNDVTGEFAWGTSLVTNANSAINDGTIFEAVAEIPGTESGLANHGTFIASEGWGLRGPLRTGFAANSNSTRLASGASFYGAMELSGNVWEQTVMIGAGGETFTGNCGDGQLAENGDANQESWCNPNTASGVLLKGGGWSSTIGEVGSWRDLAVSDRFYSHLKPTQRRNTVGGRGAR